jgi:hypothetical protein
MPSAITDERERALPYSYNPEHAVARHGYAFVHWMAFDPQYGPQSQEQIEWHRKNRTPGAESWEVGVRVS